MALPMTLDALEALEEALAENHGSIARAAAQIGCKPQHIHMWIARDPEVYNRVRAAQLIGYASLEDAAIERAVYGVEQPVFHKGAIAGYKTDYSDGLLSQLLKARVEGFSADEGHTGLTVNVAIMPRASSYEEWVIQREQALAPAQLPAPEDATYEEIPSEQPDPVRLRDVL